MTLRRIIVLLFMATCTACGREDHASAETTTAAGPTLTLSSAQAVQLVRSNCQAKFAFSQNDSEIDLRQRRSNLDRRIPSLEAEIKQSNNTVSPATANRMQRSLDDARTQRKKLVADELRAAEEERDARAKCEQEVRDFQARLAQPEGRALGPSED